GADLADVVRALFLGALVLDAGLLQHLADLVENSGAGTCLLVVLLHHALEGDSTTFPAALPALLSLLNVALELVDLTVHLLFDFLDARVRLGELLRSPGKTA